MKQANKSFEAKGIGPITSSIGASLAAICCIGFTPFLSLLAAIGAGFLINDLILLPLLAVFLALGLFSLKQGSKQHKSKTPFWFYLSSAVIVVVSIFVFTPFVWLGIAGLFVASIWNVFLLLH